MLTFIYVSHRKKKEKILICKKWEAKTLGNLLVYNTPVILKGVGDKIRVKTSTYGGDFMIFFYVLLKQNVTNW